MSAPATEIVVAPSNPFGDNWTETPVNNEPPATVPPAADTPPPAQLPASEPPAPVVPTEEKFDVNKFIKETFGYDDTETAKKSVEELKEKAKGFELNEDSQKVYGYIKENKEDELYNFLSTKKQLEKLSTADLSDKKIAAELVKFGIKNDNPTLDADEVEYIFNKKFSLPSKPMQDTINESDDDYALRITDWENQVKDKERELVIEAKIAQPKMAKLKTELVLPDIKRETPNNASVQTQEELQKIEALRGKYLQKLESDYSAFTGYDVKYKDEEVEVPISYVVTDEEKIALKEEMKTFDVDGFITERWFDNTTGEPNVKQMMEDITLLRKGKEVLQKVANETGAQVLKHYRGIKGNVVVNGEQAPVLNEEKSFMDKQVEHIWKNG